MTARVIFKPVVAQALAGDAGPIRAELVDDIDHVLIDTALRLCDENRTRAARRIGVSRSFLQYRIRELGVR